MAWKNRRAVILEWHRLDYTFGAANRTKTTGFVRVKEPMTPTIRPVAGRLFLVVGLVVVLTSHAAAQGRIRGLVSDRDGTPIAGALVTAEELAANGSMTAVSDESGRFSFIGLNRGEWLFIVRSDGFKMVQAMANVRSSGPGAVVRFTMDRDVFNPPAPLVGILAGLKGNDILEDLARADDLFDAGDYDEAIEAYSAILDAIPALSSLNLQIGHAHRAQQRPDQALAAYRVALEADPSNLEAQSAVATAGRTTLDR